MSKPLSKPSPPPTPSRCLRILQANHLECQGLSRRQIAAKMKCAPSTVSAYLRDREIHRAHITRVVASNQLLDQVHLLTSPQAEPDQHRQTVASARELRLLLINMPQIQEHEEQEQEKIETARNAEAIALARSRHWLADERGHVAYVAGPEVGLCTPECPACYPERYEGDNPLPVIPPLQDRRDERRPLSLVERNDSELSEPDLPESDLPEPEPAQPNPPPHGHTHPGSGQIQTNLDKPEHLDDEFPVSDAESEQKPQNSPPSAAPPLRLVPQQPVSRDKPLEYLPRNATIVNMPTPNPWPERFT